MSVHRTSKGEDLWIFTTFDHNNQTDVLLPDEY
jgi:hypothetical protein